MRIFSITKIFTIALIVLAVSAKAQNQPLTLEDVGNHLHGGNPLNPTSTSMLGQYLASTEAETVVRTFDNGHGEQGIEKLAVSLSDQTFTEFLNVFGSSSNISKNLFFVLHTPHSNTFYFAHKGRYGSYAMYRGNLHFSSPGTMLIPILLSDFEAERLEKFLELASISQTLARSPWRLNSSEGAYSASSHWQGCTNWVGQMPLGEDLVRRYVFPSGDDGQSPNIQRLLRYNNPPAHFLNTSGSSWDENKLSLLREVWKTNGNKQFGMMLYPQGHKAGEFTNIGWIAHVALGRLLADRSPIMFYQVGDHRTPLPVDFNIFTAPF